MLGKFDALCGKQVNVWGLELLLSIAGKITVTGIIKKNIDDIGRCGFGGRAGIDTGYYSEGNAGD